MKSTEDKVNEKLPKYIKGLVILSVLSVIAIILVSPKNNDWLDITWGCVLVVGSTWAFGLPFSLLGAAMEVESDNLQRLKDKNKKS